MEKSQANLGAPGKRRRILFFAEAVTLAHAARPVVLAQALDPDRYEVFLACDSRYDRLLGCLPFARRPLHSIPSQRFLDALAKGKPVYDVDTLRAYVKEDLALMEEIAPDLVVGDFRLSLAVSAPKMAIPYLTITNAYWSPYGRRRFPLPELPFVRILGIPLSRFLFGLSRPLAFAYHTVPLNRVRREYGLPSLGFDLCRIYTHADYTLYADVPELAPTDKLPPHHIYLGPIPWSPAVKPPDWWDDVPGDRPLVYVTLGSSGESLLLPKVLDALGRLPVYVLAATAGRIDPKQVPPNAWIADYLPGEEAARRASLVICNGGSPATHQALAAGAPVLGIVSNMDQHLNMRAVCDVGAGELLRAGKCSQDLVEASVQRLLAQPSYRKAAGEVEKVLSRSNAKSRFTTLVDELLYNHATRESSRQRQGEPS